MKKRKAGIVSVDFTGVEAGTGGRLLDEDRYQFEVEEAEVETGETSGKDYIKLTLVVVDGDFKGTKAWDNLSLQPQALWKLRGFMEAGGLETVDGEMDIDPTEFVGLVVMGDVIHEDYKGKPKHRLNGYASIDEAEATDTAGKGGGGAVRKKVGGKTAEEEAPSFKLRQKVSFKDGKKTLEGVLSAIDGETYTVKVGKDEYEMGADDLEAA